MPNSSRSPSETFRVAIIGGGPAGLMAAEVLAGAGAQVDVFDGMPSVGRKFLLAGRGGLNLTHSEPTAALLRRFRAGGDALVESVAAFDGNAVREWAAGLGIPTFVGTSGRVFPEQMKAAPLLRAWLHRLRAAGLRFHMRHRWKGWAEDGALLLESPAGDMTHRADATVLALGGASWPRLGSDGGWVPLLQARGVRVAALQPSNCGFDVAPTAEGRIGWSDHLRERFAGQPVKPVAAWLAPAASSAASMHDADMEPNPALAPGSQPSQAASGGQHAPMPDAKPVAGEFVITDTGVEGSLVYAFSADLRDRIAAQGSATWMLDLLPQFSATHVQREVSHPRGSRSLSSHLKSRLGLHGVKAALLHEVLTPAQMNDPARLAATIKALPLTLAHARPVAEAISTAGGVTFDSLDERWMLREIPGVFCAGEMLDWEAPTGGYLLTACLATGRAAARGALQWR